MANEEVTREEIEADNEDAKCALYYALKDTWSECDPNDENLDAIIEQLEHRGFGITATKEAAPSASGRGMVAELLKIIEANFPVQHGFYRSITCSECGATVSEHDAKAIWHKPDCIVGDVCTMLASAPAP